MVQNVDSLTLLRPASTLVDRRGFIRTKLIPVSFSVTTTSAQQLADVFLKSHKSTGFKGGLSATAPNGVRRVLGGEGVPPHALGLHVNELIRMAHVVDPDTGGLGRDGRIVGVSYTHADRTAKIHLDSQRDNFAAFLERLGAVTGSAVQS